MRTRVVAGGCAARYAVGVHPYVLPKLVVNDPTLLKPTVKQMSATLRSVERKSEAAGREVLMRRLTEGAAELAAEMRKREPGRVREHRHVERIAVARVDQVLRAKQMPRCRDS